MFFLYYSSQNCLISARYPIPSADSRRSMGGQDRQKGWERNKEFRQKYSTRCSVCEARFDYHYQVVEHKKTTMSRSVMRRPHL